MRKGVLKVGTGISTLPNPREAAREAIRAAVREISDQKPSLLLAFFGPDFASDEVYGVIREEGGNSPLVGCSTAGEILNGPFENSIVVGAISSAHLIPFLCQVKIEKDVNETILKLLEEEPVKLSMDPLFIEDLKKEGKQAFGLLFTPGNTRHRDSPAFYIFQAIKGALGEEIPIVGACAADQWRLEANFTLGPEGILEDSVTFGLIVTSLRYGIGMAHGYSPTNRWALVTRSRANTILELNGLPASEVIPWLFQKDLTEIEGKHIGLIVRHVLGIPDRYGKHFIVVPSFLTEEGGLRVSQPIYPGTRVVAMEPGPNMGFTSREAISRALIRSGRPYPDLGLLFSCALQWKLLGEELKRQDIEAVKGSFGGFPLAGFYSFGEQGIPLEGVNRHCNGVTSALVFCDELTPAAEIYLQNRNLIELIQRQHQEISHKAAEWEATFDAAPISIAVLDNTHRILNINKTMAEALGAPKEELLGKFCYQVVHKSDSPIEDCPLIDVCKSGVPILREKFEPGLGGWNLVGVSVFTESASHPDRLVHFAININDKKLLEEAQERIKKLETSSTIAAGIAHDFNNILTVILGSIELSMSELQEDSKAFGYLSKARDMVRKMADLIRRLLLASFGTSIKPIKIDLAVLLRTAIENKSKGAELNVNWCLEKPSFFIPVDPVYMMIAFENLIENAIEASGGRGEIYIRVRTEKVAQGQMPELNPGEYVVVTIEDRGKGIPQDALGKIFDPYYSTKQRTYKKGMGLGLTEAFSIIRSHQGTIRVESEPGVGSKFHVYLPIRDALSNHKCQIRAFSSQ
ncbi:MAG: FIST N-terminal domain-containing protein [Desulfatiglandales bacterium]